MSCLWRASREKEVASSVNGLVEPFIGEIVIVETPVGAVGGTLASVDQSHHNGLGNIVIILKHGAFWIIVRRWYAIKSVKRKR